MFKKTNRLLASLVLLAAALRAAPVAETTAVHAKADASSAPIGFISAGTEPTLAVAAAPAGWQAVELTGPHEVFVQNKDILKNLDVKPGAVYRVQPKIDAPALTTAEQGDPVEIIGLRGKWTQVRLNRKIVGFIVGTTAPQPAVARAVPTPTPTPAVNRPLAPAPVSAAGYGTTATGQAVPMTNLGDGGSSALPRLFQGKLVSTRNPLRPRRPYEYQLNDDAGVRYTYVDISRLLQTEQIEKYVDRTVVVYGAAQAVPNSKDMVVLAESLQLR